MLTPNYGLVTGRIASIAIDPSDPTGNRVFLGATGGGVWRSQNAGSSGAVQFVPLTDSPAAFDAVRYASISIGAVTVQPGGTGVVLAGTGDPNDALDSYYGAGILRSADGGNTWTIISHTADLQFLFQGEGFAGFAWSTVNPQLVVAAVSQSSEGALVNAPMPGSSYAGLYYSTDAGTTWSLNPSSSSTPVWQDLTFNPVTNDQNGFNYLDFDISSIFIDDHDPTGNTVYVTITGTEDPAHQIRTLYQTVDGGAHWINVTSNLPHAPANSVVIDPQDPNTAYVATDEAVYSTRQIASCATQNICWSVFGTGLPYAPVTQLSAAPPSASPNVLVAGTYGRGIWQIPLWTAEEQLTTVSVDPASLAFSSQTVGTTSNSQIVTLTNTGGIALAVTSITAATDFDETDNCTASALNSGASCAIQVTFSPGQPGSISGQITISANIAGGQTTIPLTGTGTDAGLLTTSPGNLDFGQVQVNTTSQTLSVTIQNAAGTPIAISGMTVTPPFILIANACGPSIAANSDCELSLAFAPTQAGSATGTLTVTDSAGTQTVALRGIGESPATDALSPASLGFPPTIAGQQSSAQVVTLTNSGDLPLTSIATSVTAGFQASSTCGTTLSAHASCALSIVFAPAAAGNLNGTLRVSDAIQTQTVALSGTALQPPAIGVSPTQLAFPAQPIGQAGTSLTLAITNTGGAPMRDVGFQLNGQSAASFSWSGSTCGATLNSGSNCTVQVTFTPAAAGPSSATLVISSSTQGVTPVQVPLSGIGQYASGISVTPAQMTFSQSTIGQPSAAQTATITNTSGTAATSLVLSTLPPFSLAQNTCSATLAAGASCTVGVIFTPAANGVVTGALTVSSSSFANAGSATLTGIGGAAGSLQTQPASLSFASTGVAAISASQTVTLTNNGQMALGSLALFVSGGFQVASNTCGTSLPIGASCTAQITFAPSSAGQQTGNLTISSSALATNLQVPLSGQGFDFTIAAQGQSNQTVASGQTAAFVIALAPMSGSSGTFSFACSSLPAHSACSFNPGTEAIAANASGSVTVQIATGVPSTSAQNHAAQGGTSLRKILFLALSAFVLPLWIKRTRFRAVSIILLFIAIAGITSCAGSGGGGGGTPPVNPNNTPAGTYSVVVTVTSSGVSHKVTLTLTVD